MKEFDHNGLLLAEFQGKLFEKSTELGCSSAIFLRRFFYSDFLKQLDKNDSSTMSLDVIEAIQDIQDQFGEYNYGKVKFSKSSLFWMGYMYRYISYTRGLSTRFVMRNFPYKQMNDVYFSFHTQDPEWCVKSLLEMNGKNEDFLDNNLRLKAIIRARMYS